jgi:hypothetical protein
MSLLDDRRRSLQIMDEEALNLLVELTSQSHEGFSFSLVSDAGRLQSSNKIGLHYDHQMKMWLAANDPLLYWMSGSSAIGLKFCHDINPNRAITIVYLLMQEKF